MVFRITSIRVGAERIEKLRLDPAFNFENRMTTRSSVVHPKSKAASSRSTPKAFLRGFTIVEFLVGLLISVILLAQICALWFYSSRSFIAQMNYVDLDRSSQYALDSMSRDIRQVKKLKLFATNSITFTDFDDKELTYAFKAGKLIRTKNLTDRALLQDVTSGSFAIYQRNPMAGAYDQYPTADPATCKLVELRWTCAKKIYPSAPSSTESMQSAKIVIRANN